MMSSSESLSPLELLPSFAPFFCFFLSPLGFGFSFLGCRTVATGSIGSEDDEVVVVSSLLVARGVKTEMGAFAAVGVIGATAKSDARAFALLFIVSITSPEEPT